MNSPVIGEGGAIRRSHQSWEEELRLAPLSSGAVICDSALGLDVGRPQGRTPYSQYLLRKGVPELCCCRGPLSPSTFPGLTQSTNAPGDRFVVCKTPQLNIWLKIIDQVRSDVTPEFVHSAQSLEPLLEKAEPRCCSDKQSCREQTFPRKVGFKS